MRRWRGRERGRDAENERKNGTSIDRYKNHFVCKFIDRCELYLKKEGESEKRTSKQFIVAHQSRLLRISDIVINHIN